MSFKPLTVDPKTWSMSQGATPQAVSPSVPAQPACQPAIASQHAAILFGCYRKADAADPEIYAKAAAAILSEYPPEVVEFVCDPRTGIARSLKWLPSIAEIAEACETRKQINAMRAELAARGKRD